MADIIPFPAPAAKRQKMADVEMVNVGRRICAEIDLMVDVACPSQDQNDRAAAWQAIAAGVILSLIGDQGDKRDGAKPFGLSVAEITRLGFPS